MLSRLLLRKVWDSPWLSPGDTWGWLLSQGSRGASVSRHPRPLPGEKHSNTGFFPITQDSGAVGGGRGWSGLRSGSAPDSHSSCPCQEGTWTPGVQTLHLRGFATGGSSGPSRRWVCSLEKKNHPLLREGRCVGHSGPWCRQPGEGLTGRSGVTSLPCSLRAGPGGGGLAFRRGPWPFPRRAGLCGCGSRRQEAAPRAPKGAAGSPEVRAGPPSLAVAAGGSPRAAAGGPECLLSVEVSLPGSQGLLPHVWV